MTFNVIDKNTGVYPDVQKIALEENWAHNLVHCDIQGFAITEDGGLVLMDECGNVSSCPFDRFDIVFEQGEQDVIRRQIAQEDGWEYQF